MSFDETIIHCGAPALCGIKPACLFSISGKSYAEGSEKLKKWKQFFSVDKTFYVSIKKSDNRFLFFIYDRLLLEGLCQKKQNQLYLAAKGYPVSEGLDAILRELFHRLAFAPDFPHEVGLFLGYPLEDVIGFERMRASGYKYSGIWKVYGNKEKAIQMMNRYKSCTDYCMKWLEDGLSVPSATRKYKKGVRKPPVALRAHFSEQA